MFKALKNLISRKESHTSTERAEIESMESQLSRMMEESITFESRRIDPDENVPTIKGAKLSYLDAKALSFWEKKRTDFKIPSYYSETAFGRNVGPALNRLLNGGYLDTGDIRKSISLKQVPELKEILSEHKLKVSGRKAELVQRLIDNLPSAELESIFSVHVYEITSKGLSALEEYSLFFDNESLGFGFPYYRLLNEQEKNPHASNQDIFLRLLSDDINKALKNGDQEQYRVKAQKLAQYFDTIGQPTDAMQYHSLSFFMFWYRNTITLGVNSHAEAYGYMAHGIDHCGQLCGYSLEKTLQEFRKALKIHNPFGLCTNRNITMALDMFKRAISVQ